MTTVAIFAGDGIGPEVTAATLEVCNALEQRFCLGLRFVHGAIGGCAIERHGVPLADADLELARGADAVFLGAVGGPQWQHLPSGQRPEDGLLQLRERLGLFANIRPVRIYPQLLACSPLKASAARGTDLVIVRELTSGLYFGRPKKRLCKGGRRSAVDSLVYDEHQIARLMDVAFALAGRRRGMVHSVDKMNVLETSRLWREIAGERHLEHPRTELRHMLVDSAAMSLVSSPRSFDVIATENTFGDILSDATAVVVGSLGMLPSASLPGLPQKGQRTAGLYEPVHGSAPDIAGRDLANPVGAILSLAMMLEFSLGMERVARAVRRAVSEVLSAGARTPDIAEPDQEALGTAAMGQMVARHIAAGQCRRAGDGLPGGIAGHRAYA